MPLKGPASPNKRNLDVDNIKYKKQGKKGWLGNPNMGIGNLVGLGSHDTKLDYKNRRLKAKRIITLISLFKSIDGKKVLDFGAGRGLVAREMQNILGDASLITAADVEYRLLDESIPYAQSEGGRLDIYDGAFNLVISNHVIEHVGDELAQVSYLRECRRLLSDDGLLYVSLPNRWTIFEPHYRAPFLSWPPEQYRDKFLALLIRIGLAHRKRNFKPGQLVHYEMRPLSRRQVKSLMKQNGLIFKDVTFTSTRLALELELGWPKPLALFGATFINTMLRPIVPSISFTATPG